jgi:hypothetical protein
MSSENIFHQNQATPTQENLSPRSIPHELSSENPDATGSSGFDAGWLRVASDFQAQRPTTLLDYPMQSLEDQDTITQRDSVIAEQSAQIAELQAMLGVPGPSIGFRSTHPPDVTHSRAPAMLTTRTSRGRRLARKPIPESMMSLPAQQTYVRPVGDVQEMDDLYAEILEGVDSVRV